jgi:hypothetical protein
MSRIGASRGREHLQLLKHEVRTKDLVIRDHQFGLKNLAQGSFFLL